MGKSSREENTVTEEVLIDRSSSEGSETLDTRGMLRKPLVHIVLIAALGFLAYSNTFHSPFQFDDRYQIIDNPVIRDLRNFTADRRGYDYNPRRFIGYLSFALNYHFGGLDVSGYHIVNLLIHIATSVALKYVL